MNQRCKVWLLSMLVVAAVSGCRGPTELFSCIDRHCFVADWTNDHSCVSCRYRCNCSTQATVSKVWPPIPAPAEKAADESATSDGSVMPVEVESAPMQ